jgi:hypothetical protein
MASREKAVVLLDGATENERLAKNLAIKIPVEEFRILYSSFLFDLLSQLINLSSTSIFLYSDNYLERNRWFGAFADRAELRPLPTEEPCLHISEALFSEGYRRLVLLGCHNPIAPLHEIQVAFHLLQLEDDSVVIGPTEKQGWYLVAVRTLHEPLLQKLPFGTQGGLDDVMRMVCGLNAMAFTTSPRYDVATIPDIERLRKEIEARIRENQTFPHKTRERFFHLEQEYNLLS